MANFLRLNFSGSKQFLKVVSKNPLKKNNEGSEKVDAFSRIPQQICYS